MGAVNGVDRLLLWVREEIAREGEGDPYAIVYAHAARFALNADAVDAAIRAAFGVERDDPRRVAFLAWLYLDGAARAGGHTAVRASTLLGALRRKAPCEHEAAREGLRVLIREGAAVALRLPREGDALVQLTPHADSEEFSAGWVAAALEAASTDRGSD